METSRKINKILFTIREIDVISCLIHGRSIKKIALLLAISPKTVEVHIRNLMLKIGCHSREKIIDFIESSESHLIIKEHYRLILEKNHLTYSKDEMSIRQDENDNFKLSVDNLNPENPGAEVVRRISLAERFKKRAFFATIITMLSCPIVFGVFYYNNKNKEHSRVHVDLRLPEKETFIKRSFLLKKMDDVFKGNKNKIKQLIIVGIGGIGKTTIARSYAMQDSSNMLWEINAENEMEIIKSFERLAIVLAKNKEERDEIEHLHMLNNMDHFKTKLMAIVQNQLHDRRNWLLIYDNVDNINDIIQYLPRSENVWGEGKILITTRNQNIVDSQYINRTNVIAVPELSAEEKKNLFFKILYPNTAEAKDLIKKDLLNKNAHQFLDKLPPYPLDVSTAAYFLKNTKMDYEKYLEDIEQPNSALKTVETSLLKDVDYNFNTRYNIVMATIQKIIARDQDFKYKLFELGLLSASEIPFALLEKEDANNNIIPFIRELARHSLISYDNTIKTSSISLHRSVHNIIYLYLTELLEQSLREKYIKNLNERVSNTLNETVNKEEIHKVRFIVPHAEELIKKAPSYFDNERDHLRYQVARAYRYLGRFKEVKPMLERIINFDENSDMLLELGTVYIREGEYNKAISIIEKALNLARKKSGPDSMEVARAEIRLDTPYRTVQKHDEARKLLEHSLAIHHHHQNVDPGDIARIYTKLGYLTVYRGHINEAIELFNKSLNIQLPLYGPNNIRTAWTYVWMAHAYKALHQHETARNVLKNSLKIYQQHFGKNHLKTAWVLCSVGEIEGVLGNFKQAEQNLQEGLEIQQKYYGKGHRRTAWALNKLADLYRRAGMSDKANNYAELFRQAAAKGEQEKF